MARSHNAGAAGLDRRPEFLRNPRSLPIIAGMTRISVSGADEADLEVRIASLTAAFPDDTKITVVRGTVYNRPGMPPTPAALVITPSA
jgi:hypothetical protein